MEFNFDIVNLKDTCHKKTTCQLVRTKFTVDPVTGIITFRNVPSQWDGRYTPMYPLH